jgi:hypothetical protein
MPPEVTPMKLRIKSKKTNKSKLPSKHKIIEKTL